MSDIAYIPDGYTREGYIAAAEGFYPAVSFHYRPLVFELTIAARDHYLMDGPEARGAVAVGFVKKCLLDWDVKDPDGGRVAIGYETIRRLNPALLERLFYVLIGTHKSDPLPGTLPSGDEAKLDEDAAYQQRLAEELRQDHDAKNSSAVSTPC